jgi:hypothetical protein
MSQIQSSFPTMKLFAEMNDRLTLNNGPYNINLEQLVIHI